MQRKEHSIYFLKMGMWILIFVYSLVVLYPLFGLITGSLKTNIELYTNILGLPANPQWSNYINAWHQNIEDYYINSTIVAGITVGSILVISSMAAYGFARFRFPGDKFLFLLLLSGMMVPPHTALIPLYLLLHKIHLFNTRWALILPYIAFGLPFSILTFRAFFLTFPHEIEDAAKIDGCSLLGILVRIILPLNKASFVIVGIVQLIFWWNEFLFALVFIEDNKLKTLPVGLLSLQGKYVNNLVGMHAAISIAIIPIIVIYIIFQEQFAKGVTGGAIKG